MYERKSGECEPAAGRSCARGEGSRPPSRVGGLAGGPSCPAGLAPGEGPGRAGVPRARPRRVRRRIHFRGIRRPRPSTALTAALLCDCAPGATSTISSSCAAGHGWGERRGRDQDLTARLRHARGRVGGWVGPAEVPPGGPRPSVKEGSNQNRSTSKTWPIVPDLPRWEL